MTSRRELVLALGGCVVGSLVVLLAASRAWVTWPSAGDLTFSSVREESAGSALRPEISASALVGLVGVAALVASRGWGRRALGLVLVLCGALVVVRALGAVVEDGGLEHDALARSGGCPASGCSDRFLAAASSSPIWPLLAALGGATLLLSGLLTAVRASRWPGMGRSYDAPGRAEGEQPATDKAVWDALDRGDDPTA